MHEIIPLPAFKDNYIWAIVPDSGPVTIVDPGDAHPVLSYLRARRRSLGAILLTHHHADHIGGVPELLTHWNVPVYAPVDRRIPCATQHVADGDLFELPGLIGRFEVMNCDGHTVPHVAYRWQDALFVGDTLFAGGCGRLLEGSAEQMYASLQRIAALPAATRVYCAHEYTLANLAFARHVDPGNRALVQRQDRALQQRADGLPTLPSHIELELETNPFLRCSEPELVAAVSGHPDDPVHTFAALRRLKDGFRG